jgi:hypothetical protein
MKKRKRLRVMRWYSAIHRGLQAVSWSLEQAEAGGIPVNDWYLRVRRLADEVLAEYHALERER